MCLTKTRLRRNTSDSATALEALQKCRRVQADRKNETAEGEAMWSCLFFLFLFLTTTDVVIPGCITAEPHICGRDFEPLARGLKQHHFHKPLLSLLPFCRQLMQMLRVMSCTR